jgi:membrane protein
MTDLLEWPVTAVPVRVTIVGMLERIKRSRVVGIARATGERYGDDAGGYLAAAIAYYGFLSFFPLMLLAVSIVGFALEGSPGLRAEVETALTRAIPGVEALVARSLRAAEDSRVTVGVVGLAGLLWTGTGVVGAGRNAVRIVFREGPPASGLSRKAWLVMVTVGLGLVGLTATSLQAFAGALESEGVAGFLLRVIAAVVAFGLDVVLFLVTYRVLRRYRVAWPDLVPGAVFVAIGWTGLKLLGAWYAGRTAEGSAPVYGAFATTVGVLVIMYLAARLYVYGAELNAVLLEERGGIDMDVERRNGRPDELSTPQLVGRMAGDVGLLIRKEVELARQEITEGISAKLQGAAAFGVAAALGLFVLGFLGAAAAAALALVLPLWAALLIVAGVVLVGAVGAALFGRSRLKETVAPERAKRTIKEDVEWARAQLRR